MTVPWFCNNCAGRLKGPECKRCGRQGAERIPPLDGFISFGEDVSDDEALRLRQEAMMQKRSRGREAQAAACKAVHGGSTPSGISNHLSQRGG